MVAQSLTRQVVHVLEQRLLHISEETGRSQLGRPLTAPPAWRGAFLCRVDRLAHARNRRVPVVAVVPAEAEATARPQDTVDLGPRQLELEPMEAGAGPDRVRHPV